jgi:hypothetical protein
MFPGITTRLLAKHYEELDKQSRNLRLVGDALRQILGNVTKQAAAITDEAIATCSSLKIGDHHAAGCKLSIGQTVMAGQRVQQCVAFDVASKLMVAEEFLDLTAARNFDGEDWDMVCDRAVDFWQLPTDTEPSATTAPTPASATTMLVIPAADEVPPSDPDWRGIGLLWEQLRGEALLAAFKPKDSES